MLNFGIGQNYFRLAFKATAPPTVPQPHELHIDNKEDQRIVFSKDPRYRDFRLAAEVSALAFPSAADEDSD